MNPNAIPAPFTVSMTPPPAIRERRVSPQIRADRFPDELLSGLFADDFTAKLTPNADPFANGWNAAMMYQAEHPTPRRLPMPLNVIFHNPATIVYWDDGDKTVVKCQPGDVFSEEAGLTAAMLKKYMGNDNTFNKVINEWLGRANHASIPALPVGTM